MDAKTCCQIVENNRSKNPCAPDASFSMADQRINSDSFAPVHERKDTTGWYFFNEFAGLYCWFGSQGQPAEIALENPPGVGGLGSNFEPDTGQLGGQYFQKLPEKIGFRRFSTVGEGTLCSTMFQEVADVHQPG